MTTLAHKGVGSKWMTGALQVPPEQVVEAVGGEGVMVGMVWYGYEEGYAKKRGRKMKVEDVHKVV